MHLSEQTQLDSLRDNLTEYFHEVKTYCYRYGLVGVRLCQTPSTTLYLRTRNHRSRNLKYSCRRELGFIFGTVSDLMACVYDQALQGGKLEIFSPSRIVGGPTSYNSSGVHKPLGSRMSTPDGSHTVRRSGKLVTQT